jgi:hypothetical protein
MALSWKPVRRGNRFCAPACGRGCTVQEHRDAERQALKLAARLASVQTDVKGRRWKIRLFENLGWHWRITKGAVTVYKSGRTYSACFNISGPWGGNAVSFDDTPERAIKSVLDKIRVQLVPMVDLARRLKVQ